MSAVQMKYPGRESVTSYRTVCFVCGSTGATGTLYTKPRSKGPYFPFLEHHEPPKGAALPNSEGAVQACTICFAFLQQQWESFERNKTPAIKRLYWLKRCDNGTFTGAEMHLQGEYVSQMLGLQYVPGTYACGDHTPIDGGTSLSPTPAPVHKPPAAPQRNRSFDQDVSGALDLSVGNTSNKSSESYSPRSLEKRMPSSGCSSIYCFLCNTRQPEGLMRFIYTRKNTVDEPFFTFLESIAQKHDVAVTTAGLTRVCSNCRKTLHRQWRGFEVSNTPEEMRIYHINDTPVNLDHIKQTTRKDLPQQDVHHVCYICTKEYSRDQLDYIHSKAFSKSRREIFFPFIALLQKPPGAKPIDANGCVLACVLCRETLNKQWSMYDSQNVPEEFRQYYLSPYTSTSHKGYKHLSPGSFSSQQPLNISISSAEGPLSSQGAHQGLLAIAPGATTRRRHSSSSSPTKQIASTTLVYSSVPIKKEPGNDDSGELIIDVGEENVPQQEKKTDADEFKPVDNPGRMLCSTPSKEDGVTFKQEVAELHVPSGMALSPVSPPDPVGYDQRCRERPSSAGSQGAAVNVHLSPTGPEQEGDSSISPGLPQGPKPPPLSMLSPAATKVTRTTATVQPLNQSLPSSGSPTAGSSAAISATRQSSFAAALRKLAKQATDLPEGGPAYKAEGGYESSPGSSSVARTPTPKRGHTAYPSHNPGGHVHSPPVVTIAPTSHTSAAMVDGRKSAERPGTASSSSGSMVEPISVKQERERTMQPLALDRRDDDRPRSKETHMSSHSAHKAITPSSASSVPGSRHEETSVRGFQPYRAGEELRPPVPSHYPALDPSLYPYHAAAAAAYMTPHGFPHPAFRFDDPLMLERYRMLQSASSYYPYSHPGMLPPAGLGLGYHSMHGYPGDLLRQAPGVLSPPGKIHDLRSPAHSERAEEERRREQSRELEREHGRQVREERQREERLREERHREERQREEDRRRREEARSHNGPVHHEAQKLASSQQHSPHGSRDYLHLLDRRRWEEQRAEQRDKHQHSSLLQNHREHHSQNSSSHRPSSSESHSSHHPPSLLPPGHSLPHHNSHSKDGLKNFHRPFETSIVNGLDKSHWLGHSDKHKGRSEVKDLSITKQEVPSPRLHVKVEKEQRHDGMHSLLDRDSHFSSSTTCIAPNQPSTPHSAAPINNRQLNSSQSLSLKGVSTYHYTSASSHLLGGNKKDQTRTSQEGKSVASSHPIFNPSMPIASLRSDHPAVILNQPQLAPTDPANADGEKTLGRSEETYSKLKLGDAHKKTDAPHSRLNSLLCNPRPPISILDQKEQQQRSGQSNDNHTVCKEKEAKLQNPHRLLMTNGPSRKLDRSSVKMGFLHNFGLTSKQEDSELSLLKQCNRRKLFDEPSLTQPEVSSEDLASSALRIPNHINPEDLNRESDYKYKAQFLFLMGLQVVPPDRRREMCAIHAACERDREKRHLAQQERLSRNLESLTNKKRQGVHGEIAEPTPLSLKRKQLEQEENPQPAKKASTDHNHVISHPPNPQDSHPSVMSSQESRHKYLHQASSREFAQEFHKSVLASTKQQEMAARIGLPQSTSSPQQPRESSSRPRVDNSEAFRWPGIEVLLEAYQRHVEEQNLEKQVILEECQSLRRRNQELTAAAEKLSNTMSEMLENKKKLEQERFSHQKAVDALKNNLRKLR